MEHFFHVFNGFLCTGSKTAFVFNLKQFKAIRDKMKSAITLTVLKQKISVHSKWEKRVMAHVTPRDHDH